MIDVKDKGTQPLDLGEAPKRRGRPSTGKALSNADRQRAYRERQKALRDRNEDADVIASLERKILGLEEDRVAAQQLLKTYYELWEKACKRVKALEKKLAQRNGK